MFQKQYWERTDLDKRRKPDHPVIAEYVLSKVERLKPYMTFNERTTLLDVGCGNGFFTYYFNKICRTTGVDYSQKMLGLNPAGQKAQMDAGRLGFRDNSFDIVFCHALLHHVDDIGAVIREMARVSRKHVVILEPNRSNPLMFLFSAIVKEERNALKFTRRYLKRIAETNGLDIVDSFSCGMIVPNKMPSFMLPVVKLLNFKQPWGMTNFIIGTRKS